MSTCFHLPNSAAGSLLPSRALWHSFIRSSVRSPADQPVRVVGLSRSRRRRVKIFQFAPTEIRANETRASERLSARPSAAPPFALTRNPLAPLRRARSGLRERLRAAAPAENWSHIQMAHYWNSAQCRHCAKSPTHCLFVRHLCCCPLRELAAPIGGRALSTDCANYRQQP